MTQAVFRRRRVDVRPERQLCLIVDQILVASADFLQETIDDRSRAEDIF